MTTLAANLRSLRGLLRETGSPLLYLSQAWFKVRYRTTRRRIGDFIGDPARLRTGSLAPLIEALDRDGYVRLPNALLPMELLQELKTETERRLRSDLSRAKHKKYWTEIFSKEESTVDAPQIQAGLHRPFIDLAAAYLGETPYLTDSQVHVSRFFGDDWFASQLMHRDYDDTAMLKIFVYLSDVLTEEDGPFTLLPKADSMKVKNTWVPDRVSDATLQRIGLWSEIVPMHGPAFTAFAVNTNHCYHFGSRVREHHTRLMLTVTYSTFGRLWHYPRRIRATGHPNTLEALVLGHSRPSL